MHRLTQSRISEVCAERDEAEAAEDVRRLKQDVLIGKYAVVAAGNDDKQGDIPGVADEKSRLLDSKYGSV